MYFPILKPIEVKKGSRISILLWRLTKSAKVWYEWAMSFQTADGSAGGLDTEIHNFNGEHYWIGSTI